MVRLADSEVRTREVLGWKGLHLFHHPISSCSQKVRIFLNIKGVKWESHIVDLAATANMDEWYLGINPRGLVPALVHDGEVHIESNDVLLHLERAFPQPCLLPDDQFGAIGKLLHHEDELHLDLRGAGSLRAFGIRPVERRARPRQGGADAVLAQLRPGGCDR